LSSLTSGDEFSDIAHSFNKLLLALREQEESLRKQERLALLGTLQAEFAHEVSNPLAAIISLNMRIQESGLESNKKSENLLFIDKTVRIGDFLLKLLNSFRSASRSESGKDAWHQTSLPDLAEMASLIGGVKAKRMGVKILVESSHLESIHTDSAKLLQVINNLVSNAIDAAIENPQSFSGKWVRIECFNRDGRPVIRVIDSGSGIQSEQKDKLFTRFSTSKSIAQGTGLGLALSAQIATELGGHLRYLDSEIATTFELEIQNQSSLENASWPRDLAAG
jgi:signal transduction histidine kinase